MRLTKAVVAKLKVPEGKSEALIFDDDLPGFGVRIRASGSMVWIIQYRIGNRQRRMTFGRVSAMTAEQARQQAGELLAKVRLGEDPQATKHAARKVVEIKPATLGDVVPLYLDYAAQRQKERTFTETKRHLTVAWAELHGMPLEEIDRRAVALGISRIATRSGPISANRARAMLSALFGWAMREGIASHNPVIGSNKAKDEKARERALTPSELRAIWQATEGPGDYNSIVRLLLLTGQRREEVAALTWAELDFERGEWLLSGERTKNGRAHAVPLSPQALAVLGTVERREGRELLFGAGKGPFAGWSQCKARLDRRSEVTGWRLHDLRRTVVTGMAELGVQPHVVESVVNHVSGHKAGVAGVYNRATYAAEKRTALQIWADHLTEIITGEAAKVVPIRQREHVEQERSV